MQEASESKGMNPALKVILIVGGILLALGCGIVVIAIFIVGTAAENVGEAIKREATAAQMAQLETAIDAYRMNNGELPGSLDDIVGMLASETVPLDGWSNPFVYTLTDDGTSYELISYGADGVEGGEGDDADMRVGR